MLPIQITSQVIDISVKFKEWTMQGFQNTCGYVMEPAHKKIENIDQRLQNQLLQGGNLLYITQMNNSWIIQMTKSPFYIYQSKGSQCNQSRHNSNNIRAQQ